MSEWVYVGGLWKLKIMLGRYKETNHTHRLDQKKKKVHTHRHTLFTQVGEWTALFSIPSIGNDKKEVSKERTEAVVMCFMQTRCGPIAMNEWMNLYNMNMMSDTDDGNSSLPCTITSLYHMNRDYLDRLPNWASHLVLTTISPFFFFFFWILMCPFFYIW